jgi:hypothetical protein
VLVVSEVDEDGLVDAVVFKLPLVFSFVVLVLELGLELVLPYVELVEDGVLLADPLVEPVAEPLTEPEAVPEYVESVLELVLLDGEVLEDVLLDGELL